MNKVAIVTITNSGLNFGNRLQNYALQEILKKYGLFPETIYSANVVYNSLILSKLRRIIKKLVIRSKRRTLFNEFDRKYIIPSKKIRYGSLNASEFNNYYVGFIAGSDQIWNPNFHFNSDFEFLTFTEPEKRYSYAASFGVDYIPETMQENYKRWLIQMNRISVREEKGRALIMDLIGRECQVHIDPVMLLDKYIYNKIAEKPSYKIPEKYLLVYILGNFPKEYDEFINSIAYEKKIEIIQLRELPTTELFHIGPQHFLYLFSNADYICTDSFHGTAFSIIFEKSFTSFYRIDNEMSMNCRMDTLLEKMNLSSRLFGKTTTEKSLQSPNYNQVNENLQKERLIAEEYLTEISRFCKINIKAKK